MRSSNASSYLSRLDHLRFVAAALVIVYHFSIRQVGAIGTANPLLSLIDEGHTGVALFMVMSGFIFAVIAYGKDIDYGAFLRNRFIRIYPLYLFALLMSVYIGRQNYGFMDVLGALAPFLNLRNPPSVNSFDQLWTIAVEFQFYLIFPFLCAFHQRRGLSYLLGLLGLLVLCRALVYGVYGTIQDLSYWTIFGRLDQFLIGMMLGAAYRTRPGVLSHPLYLLAFIALLLGGVQWFNNVGGFYGVSYPSQAAYWVVLPTLEGLLWGGIVLAYVNCRIRVPRIMDQALAWLGQISFSLYVMHNLVIFFLLKHVGAVPFRAGHDVFNTVMTGALVALPLTIGLASLTYYLIEAPFLEYRVKYVRQQAPAP